MKRDILVIDDDNSFGWLLNKILNDKFNVVNVAGSISAMKWLSEGNLPRLIICDYNLPVMNGIEFKEKLNLSGSFSNIPFILVTAMLDKQLAEKSEKVGILEYLQKPFDPRMLKEKIGRIIERKPVSTPI